jgi:2-polyprenyl-3-methyl-5-hydroxy-6-metoxy-1,4-benzoquinol methylase
MLLHRKDINHSMPLLNIDYPSEIKAKMQAYWGALYRDQLGLENWQVKVDYRLQEENNAERYFLELESWFGTGPQSQHRVLVVGGGTGAEFISLALRGCEVYAVEPDRPAVQIAHEKARYLKLPASNFLNAVGETLPFEAESFDWVWCWSVLEHVQDVEACLQEMVRVTKVGGRIFISTPDYRQFFEGHYKIAMPMFLPKWSLKIWLALKGRPTAFLNTLQWVNSRKLGNSFQKLPVIALYAVFPWEAYLKSQTLHARLTRWMVKLFSIYPIQVWILCRVALQSEKAGIDKDE